MLVPVCLLLLASGPAPIDQARPPAPSPGQVLTSAPMRGADELAKGWTALAAGRAGDAETIADALLKAGTRRHDALLLKVHARVQAGRTAAALDAYEETLRGAPAEDVYLVQPIARGLLDALSRGDDLGVRILALKALAQAGDRDAAARLGDLAAGDQTGAADTALAGLDNPRAIARLEQRVATAGPRADVSEAIDALANAKAISAVKSITGALDRTRPLPTKLAAARALGLLDARDAIPQLQQALHDPDPSVQMMAAAALSRLGDQSGADLLRAMETSPVADIRLMLAEIAAPRSPDGPWVATALKAMEDPDPLVRLSAAELVVKYSSDPRPGLAVLTGALADSNPAMRLAASRELSEVPTPLLGNDLPSLRKWLRDAAPEVRIAAAAAVLRLAGGVE